MTEMYIKYRDGKPVAYRYGEEWAAMQLLMEGGYPTEEEAIAAWKGRMTMAHKDCYGKCDRCVWRDNGGCSEWRKDNDQA